jgi:hypothetical protein
VVTGRADSLSRMCMMVRLMRRPAWWIDNGSQLALKWITTRLRIYLTLNQPYPRAHTSTPLWASCGALS